MKHRYIILTTLILVAIGATAQTGIRKGEQSCSVTLGFSSKSQESYLNGTTLSPDITSTELMAAIGYTRFITDKVALSLSVGVPYAKSPINGSADLSTTAYGLNFSPEVRFYLPITERLFWVTSIGFAFEFGNYKEDLTGGGTAEADYTGWVIGVSPLGIEFRASEKISLGVALGGFYHTSTSINVNGNTIKVIQSLWKLNSANLSLHFWF